MMNSKQYQQRIAELEEALIKIYQEAESVELWNIDAAIERIKNKADQLVPESRKTWR